MVPESDKVPPETVKAPVPEMMPETVPEPVWFIVTSPPLLAMFITPDTGEPVSMMSVFWVVMDDEAAPVTAPAAVSVIEPEDEPEPVASAPLSVIEPAPPTCTMPLLIVVAPVKVFTPVSVSVELVLVSLFSAPPPETMPENV